MVARKNVFPSFFFFATGTLTDRSVYITQVYYISNKLLVTQGRLLRSWPGSASVDLLDTLSTLFFFHLYIH